MGRWNSILNWVKRHSETFEKEDNSGKCIKDALGDREEYCKHKIVRLFYTGERMEWGLFAVSLVTAGELLIFSKVQFLTFKMRTKIGSALYCCDGSWDNARILPSLES